MTRVLMEGVVASPIGRRSSQGNVLVGKVELDSILPITKAVVRRPLQTPGTNVSICLRRKFPFRKRSLPFLRYLENF